ncbi:MAG TPA: prolipoprotein diacylglyceryl transferase [Burkholderiaceae bacterium]|nr:prolipoprotein diacylglyceryl transferase [Burkholderiaceae bacterium]
MLVHPNFDPIALQLGPLAIRWYGLMYLVAFAAFYLLGRMRVARTHYGPSTGLAASDVEDLLFYGVIGVILGGRLGYVLFYKPGHYLSNPLEALAIWQGGMAFHGGLVGVLVACAVFASRRGLRFLQLMDFVAPLVPLGLAAGRLGNFINGELWGRATDLPWGMVFPQDPSGLARHPSQLYQFAGEGLLLFALLWWYSSRPRAEGRVSGLFLLGYGTLRFLAEFGREPDAFLGLLAGGLSMGQLLSLPMVAAGLWLMTRRASAPFAGATR